MQISPSEAYPEGDRQVYQGQFGEFTITSSDRQGVIIYRIALMVAALSFNIGSTLILWQGATPEVLQSLTWIYAIFCGALGIALATIHIYLAILHRALQVFLGIGCVSAIAVGIQNSEPLALTVYQNPTTLLGIGFTFVALTGIFFKESFCFNRFEAKLLTVLVPFLLLGHLLGKLPPNAEQVILGVWAILFLVFAARKLIQAIPPDIGDKSVFAYLKQ